MPTWHLDKKTWTWVEGSAPVSPRVDVGPENLIRKQEGISFQFPPGWDDGSGKVRHVPSGEHKGRVMWTSRQEAIDNGKRLEDVTGASVQFGER